MHVAIWAFHNLRWPLPGYEIDHKNRDKLNNRIENLRELTREQQRQNTKIWSTNTSGTRNVCYHKSSNSWRVVLMVYGVTTTRYYKTKDDAERMADVIINTLTERYLLSEATEG